VSLYVVAGVIIAGLGFLVWFAIRERKAGAVTEQAKVATKTVEVQQKMDQAGAAAPRSREGVQDALDKGTF